MTAATTAIGWIGLGKMGEPMAEHLLAKGYSLRVYDLNPQSVQALVAKGAIACASIAELAAASSVVISIVPDDRVLKSVSEEVLANLAPGATYMDMSTVSPEASVAAGELARQRGVAYICAPVSGSTELARKGVLTVFASGPAEAYQQLETLLSSFAATRHYVGAEHQARYLKLAINHLVGSSAALMAEALSLGRKGGLDWKVMLDVMGNSVIASPLIKYKLDLLASRDFAPAFSAAQMRKDMGLVNQAGQNSGTHMPLAALVAEYFEAYAQQKPDNDFFGLVEAVEAQSDLPPLPRD